MFNGNAQFGAAAKDSAGIELVGLAAQNLTAGRVAKDAGIGILDGAQNARSRSGYERWR